jgi:hypothetical protein
LETGRDDRTIRAYETYGIDGSRIKARGGMIFARTMEVSDFQERSERHE